MARAERAMPFRYAQLADDMEAKIKDGIYKAGEKLPSLRKLHSATGLSITTIYQAYIELENRGVVEPRQKSGYYVKPLLRNILPCPDLENLRIVPKKVTVSALAYAIVQDMSNPDLLQFGGTAVVPDLLPCKQLVRAIKTMPAEILKDMISRYENPSGSQALKIEIAKQMVGHIGHSVIDEILITSGCIEAVSLCLQAVAGSGDTIVVESPTYPWFLQIIQDLNMYALEMPTDPATGIDPDALEAAIDKNNVKACLMIPNFHNPLGFEMPVERKKKLVAMLSRKNVPIIEDNIHGELYFGKSRPITLKSLDKKGLVLHCSSFSKTLAPGLRVGWTLPGKFKDRVRQLKLNMSIASPTLNQHIVAEFLKSGAYDRHLRQFRTALKNQVANTALAIARYFPNDTKITSPMGGLTLWVQLGKKVSGLKVYEMAGKEGISIFPGIICSATDRYKNHIRISCGNPWSERVEKGIKTLGEIVAQLNRAHP